MRFVIGIFIVLGCIAGGYAMHHGNFAVLWQPNEIIIIFGSAAGATVISNPPYILKGIVHGMTGALKGAPHSKQEYVAMLVFLFTIFKTMKSKGVLAIEQALDNPDEHELFTKHPDFLKKSHGVEFFCDYIRLVTMGMENPYHLEDLMEKDIEGIRHEGEAAATALATVADGLPALGIVAAVLGVIQTMGSIAEPPEVLGGLIGAALVGTFLGILLGYGIFGPLASCMAKRAAEETEFFIVLKAGILAHVQGNAPAVTIEFARKMTPEHLRPSFKELDDTLNSPNPAQETEGEKK
jgi:chemotaxis protein MotA